MQKIIRIDEPNETILSDRSAECYVLNSALADDFCKRFIEKASDKVVLFYGDKVEEKSKALNADGVIVDFGADDLKEKMAQLRKTLGKGKYVGLFTRNRRHESMLVSEVEPDFVVFKVYKDGFDKVKELTDWYQEFFLIQSAAWIMEDGVPVDELKTDFVIVQE
jgi:hypothetical protein